jgi:ABC-type multidrug transport system fused ATPase/permease subunit
MSQPKNIQEFFDENVSLVKEYIETKTTVYKLKATRTVSSVLGTLAWLIISAFFIFLLFIFIGLVLGFWFSEMTGSFVSGFGLATLSLVFVIFLLTIFRRQLFIHPLIRIFIQAMTRDEDATEESTEKYRDEN